MSSNMSASVGADSHICFVLIDEYNVLEFIQLNGELIRQNRTFCVEDSRRR